MTDMVTRAERESLRTAAEKRKAAALALKQRAGDVVLRGQFDVAVRLFEDVDALFLTKVDPGRRGADDELWLMGADAYFRAACVFLEGLAREVTSRDSESGTAE